MTDNVTIDNGDLTDFESESYDTGDGQRQIVALGAAGTKTFSVATFDDTTPEEVVAASATRQAVTIANYSGGRVFLGNSSGVTSLNGFPLEDGAVLSDPSSVDAWWAVADTDVDGDLRIVVVA